ncbi:glycosyltransferase [Vulgatibacter incomptus]|uniref:Glycosyl transferase, group 1 family protein n=1 Tax=Vulgatibacter incomptus TaxID=1391653 RepID=A0A0K1PCR6_9BACT|nr:glycosyltransferase [Vulgatibacter incomptus]AKU91292.1 Glycosyl transferase, group 1 family protein [Vulgatibacter incomptus]
MPSTVLHLVNILGVGGAEGQFVERVRMTDRGSFRPLVAALDTRGRHLPELRALGLEPAEFRLPRSFAHPMTFGTVARLAIWMRAQQVRLVHAQDFYTNLVAVPAARLAGAKVIVSRLDLAHWHGPRRRLALAWASRLADKVQVNAEAIARQLRVEEGIDPSRIVLVRNGIDLGRFDARAAAPLDMALPVPPGSLVAAVIANLHPIKGQEDVVQAVARLAPRFPSLHLVLVGEGERRGPIVRCAAALGISDHVHLLGHRADVPAILGRCRMLISSSYAEGLSNSVIEGMASRLPVVATAVGGTPELVDGRTRGLLVPPRSPARLADAIERLLEEPDEARAFGTRARAFVEEHLEIGHMAQRFNRLYEAVLG